MGGRLWQMLLQQRQQEQMHPVKRHIPVRRVGIPPPVGMACLSITIPFT